jgi:hypothetical protein
LADESKQAYITTYARAEDANNFGNRPLTNEIFLEKSSKVLIKPTLYFDSHVLGKCVVPDYKFYGSLCPDIFKDELTSNFNAKAQLLESHISSFTETVLGCEGDEAKLITNEVLLTMKELAIKL